MGITLQQPQSILYNQKILIKILPNSFAFGCINQYVGWEHYVPEITRALDLINSTNVVNQWNRVGIRYITHYPNKDIRDCTKFKYSFGLPDIKSEAVSFSSQFGYKNSQVVINLHNQVPIMSLTKDGTGMEQIPTSIIDIDVIRTASGVKSIEELLSIINELHNHEKELYFEMLTQEFLESLHPEY